MSGEKNNFQNEVTTCNQINPIVAADTTNCRQDFETSRKPGPRAFLRGATALLSLMALAHPVDAGQRPISDFLSRQGKFCLQFDANGFLDCSVNHYVSDTTVGGCVLFTPPGANFTGWTDPRAAAGASFDYAGLNDVALGGILGTTMDGSIDEVLQADGRVIVQVVLHTHRALTFAVASEVDFTSSPLLFGHRAAEVLAGAQPSLGSCTLKLVFRNPAPGAPLPDIEELFFCRFADFLSIYFVGQSDGILPNGKPGR
jgi:hypothetical protein